jgi:UPF0755 protein
VKRSKYFKYNVGQYVPKRLPFVPQNRYLRICLGILIFIFITLLSTFAILTSAPVHQADAERFTISLTAKEPDIVNALKDKGFIKNSRAFNFILSLRGLHNKITPGGYVISKSMSAWDIASVLGGKLVMAWVIIPEGMRKEEIADILAEDLHWTKDEKSAWINVDTTINQDTIEGVYFPDTYLISLSDTPRQVADKLRSTFDEKFSSLAKEARDKNIKWTTVVTLASILQREAAGKDDMPTISGILWNRLNQGMKLDIDATVQYARGNTGKGWWAPIAIKDKSIPSSYNTYIYKGLPPHPISNPGLEALTAAVHPAKTVCLFYIHDYQRKIHCAATYDEQLNNIDKYLR